MHGLVYSVTVISVLFEKLSQPSGKSVPVPVTFASWVSERRVGSAVQVSPCTIYKTHLI